MSKSKEEKLWDYLVKTLSKLNDNNFTARKIYDKVESLTPILFIDANKKKPLKGSSNESFNNG